MSTSALRDTFNAISLPKGIRCTEAFLSYCDANGTPDGFRDHQRLVFSCSHLGDNTTREWTSEPLPPGTDIMAATQALANKAIGG